MTTALDLMGEIMDRRTVVYKTCSIGLVCMLPPCHFLLYSSNIIVTLTEETNRSSHSDTKRLDHFIACNIIGGAINGSKILKLKLVEN